MKAEKHPMEAARVAALHRYDILDTPRESDFDDIVELTSRICDVPVSVVNLIDSDRQWFKAEIGLGVRETPLDTSICSHVILENDFVEIPDTLADPRMADNPLCTGEPGFRFYAGSLLKTADGYPIGTLCVLDFKPRVLTDLQRSALRVLARRVMRELELRAHIANEAVLRKEIDHRVKNSLATVGAFVQLKKREVSDEAALASLDSVGRQIEGVAMLHEELARDRDDSALDLDRYLARVTGLLDETTAANVAIDGTFDARRVRLSDAAVIATIVNELVANAIKHSFTDGEGTVTITGTTLANGLYRLTCRDDGNAPFSPPGPGGRTGLGMSIIKASVRQLGGTLEIGTDDSGGYRTTIDLPLVEG